MAILQVLGTDKALRMNDYDLQTLVASFDWNPNLGAQDIMEMGSTARVDTAFELETQGSLSLTSNGNTAGFLARMRVNRGGVSGTDFLGFKYLSGSAAGKNAYTLTQDDMAEMRFDLLLHEKPDQKTFSRSLWLYNSFLTSFSGQVDTNSIATETYNFSGSAVLGFPAPFHDLRVVPAKFVSGTTVQLIDTNATSPGAVLTLGTGYSTAYFVADGRLYTNKNTDATYLASVSTGGLATIASTEGFVFTADMVVAVAVYKSTTPSTTFPTVGGATGVNRFKDSASRAINYVKAYQANVYLAPSNINTPVATEQWLRLQSFSWTVNLNVATLEQIGVNPAGTSIYARVPTFPLDIQLSASVTETDWADWKALLKPGKGFDGTTVTDNTFEFAPAFIKNSFGVVVEYRTRNNAPMQKWQFTDCRIDGYGTRAAIGGRGEVTWPLKATQFNLIGLNP